MRDAQQGLDAFGGSWPADVLHDLPVGVLEMDDRGRILRTNPALTRLLAAERIRPPRGGGAPGQGERLGALNHHDRVADRWPLLAAPAAVVLAGRPVDVVLHLPGVAVRVRGVPRWTEAARPAGLLVVTEAEAPGHPVVGAPREPTGGRHLVLDLRDGVHARRGERGGGTTEVSGGAADRPPPAPSGQRGPDRAAGRRRALAGGRADEHAATHDPVTGLPNSVLLRQCLGEALAACRPGRRVAVLTVDVRDPSVPAQAEPEPDDALLLVLAERLSRLMDPRDVVARLHGSCFAVVVPEVRPDADLDALLLGMAERLAEPVNRPGRPAVGPGPVNLAMVLADSAGGASGDPGMVLALALEALERSRSTGHPVVGTERPVEAERARLAALRTYDIYDPELDDVLQALTQVAASTCGTAASLITFVDSDLQWVRAACGAQAVGFLDANAPRHLALCDRTLRSRGVLVVPDTARDGAFRISRHVGWQVGMRFYAGAPLITPEGRAVGTLCVLDPQPRDVTERQRHSLTVLAAEVVAVLEAHRTPPATP